MAPSISSLSDYLTHGEAGGPYDYGHRTLWNNSWYLSWSRSAIAAVVYYVTTVTGYSNLNEDLEVCDTITLLNDVAREIRQKRRTWELLPWVDVYENRTEKDFSEIFMKSFVPQVKRFFTVYTRNCPQYEVLASFLSFLLEVLYSQENEFSDVTQWDAISGEEGQWYAVLRKELMFLVYVLGDEPFQLSSRIHPELAEQVSYLLAQYEMLANEVGTFIYSFVLSVPPVDPSQIYAEAVALLVKVEFLKANIREYCIKFSDLQMHVTWRSDNVDAADSSFIFDSFLQDLENITSRNLNSTIDSLIKTLHHELTSSENFLRFLKVPKESDEEKMKRQIRNLACEAEYLIKSHLKGKIPIWYVNLRLPAIIQKIVLTRENLQQITKACIVEGIKGSASGYVSSLPMVTPATKGYDTIHVGFEDNMTRILEDLIGEPKSPRQVVSIYGMPGLGKTTVAYKLYNHRSVCMHFDRCAWVVVSQTYNVRELMIQILMSLTDESNKDIFSEKDVTTLSVDIHKCLKQRRYLIVLDDIWDSNVWDALQRYFPDDENGSRVIFTSRIKDVAPGGSILHTLPLLSTDQSWDLLRKKLFPNESCPLQLLRIGKGIAAKCSGLPLAVVTTAGILVNLEKEESAWERVEKQLELFLIYDQSDYRKILELSYEHFPHNIKPCFLYLATFPEDTEIPVKKLLWLWIAEGFISREEGRSPEETAEMYFSDLLNRSLVITGKRRFGWGIKTCRIHDLLHGICIRKALEENFLGFTYDCSHFYSYQRYRRWFLLSGSKAHRIPFGLHCRSLISPFSHPFWTWEMPLLRVVDMMPSNCSKVEPVARFDLPDQLRYLCMNPTRGITSFDNFVNLEFLCLKQSTIFFIPLVVILNMVKLRHVVIKPGVRFAGDCVISQASKLRSLSRVSISFGGDAEFLRHCPHIRQLKCSLELRCFSPDLHCLTKLESLKIAYGYKYSILLERLLPTTIKKLSLFQTRLPWENMSIIGELPILQVLKLDDDAFVGKIWETNDEEFKELRFLKIKSCHDLREWISESDHFPSLERLVLSGCTNLQEVPSDLGNIPTLERIEVTHSGLGSFWWAAQTEEEQHEMGNTQLQVIINGDEWPREKLFQICKKKIKKKEKKKRYKKNKKMKNELKNLPDRINRSLVLPAKRGSDSDDGMKEMQDSSSSP